MYMSKKRNDLRTPERIKTISSLYQSKNLREIAEQYGTTKITIGKILKEAGVSLREPHKRKGVPPWNKGKPYYAIRGEKNPNWKGGISKLNSLIRQGSRYKKWRKDVMERDDFTCQLCNKRGGDKEVDHFPVAFCVIMEYHQIKTYEQALACEKLWDIANGRTLCVECHRVTKL